MSKVDIGFVECTKDIWLLNSAHFPSKVGGKPAWLSYKDLPQVEELLCPSCVKPRTFFLQIYAPYEEDPSNFHRTVFLFICKNVSCAVNSTSNSVLVLRDNLPRNNEFYSHDPPDEKSLFNADEFGVKLCALCGCSGTKICSKCRSINCCCREHQVLHWKEVHKNSCGSASDATTTTARNTIHLFPEYEIVIEPEEEKKDARESSSNKVDAEEELRKYEDLKSAGKAGTLLNASDAELEQHAAVVDDDKAFKKFRRVVARNPEQILRYERGGEPLWIALGPLPDEIPACESCGGARRFEFQVMPQILAILKENEVDFGVLAVYTCEKSCSSRKGYKKEFVFKQDVAQ